ncbi:NAD(P)-binding protein [Hymenopellis radicata]|nr:NAD(P)-binding protein [Hymenopellis radicata]
MSHLTVSNIMSLHGQVALVTGGGTGIGFMIAKGFAANGAKVYITGRREEVLRKAAASLSAKEGVLIPIVMDVTNQTSIDNAVKHLEAVEGRLDTLVQKKMDGLTGNKDPLEHETFQGWADVFRTNISASFFVVRSFLDLLVKGAQARQSTASFGYGPSKGALDKLSIGLATDFAHRGIPVRVNVLNPGMFPSEMVAPSAIEKIDTALPGLIAPVPVRRAGTEEEMVMTAMYLAACTYANGASIAVDGGITLVNP